MKDIEIGVVGALNWTQLRQFIIDLLNDVKTEKQFESVLGNILLSIGTKEQLIEARKKLEIPVDDEFLKQIDDKLNEDKT